MNQTETQKNDKGFTLIELLIVIVILGVLAAVIVFRVANVTDEAETNACELEVRAVNTIGTSASASDSAVAADVPAQLTGFSATLSSGDAVLAWTLGTSNPAITDVEYQVSTDGGTTWGSWTSLATTGSGATITACSSTTNDTCDYRVRAVNAIGSGAASASSGFTIP